MAPKQSLISSFLVTLTPEEKAERDSESFAKIGDELGKVKAKAKFALQSRAEKERLQALQRQRKRRARLKEEEIAAGIRSARTGELIKEVRALGLAEGLKLTLTPRRSSVIRAQGESES